MGSSLLSPSEGPAVGDPGPRLEMLPVCKGARPPQGHLEAQAGPDHPRPGLCPPEPFPSPAQPTPAKCGGSTCLGAVSRAQIPECPNPGSVWGGGCSVRLQDGFHSGGLRRGTSGPGGRGPIYALEPPWQDGLLLRVSARGLCGKGGAGAGLGEGGPLAARGAPPSSLPGSIRDLTPSNAAQ